MTCRLINPKSLLYSNDKVLINLFSLISSHVGNLNEHFFTFVKTLVSFRLAARPACLSTCFLLWPQARACFLLNPDPFTSDPPADPLVLGNAIRPQCFFCTHFVSSEATLSDLSCAFRRNVETPQAFIILLHG